MDRFAEYVALVVALHGVALVIVNLTPTPKDNETLDTAQRLVVRLYRTIEIFAGIIGPRVKR
jgi:hypothetical protein